ncbi:MAG: N-acetylmuramoyl-L-alanine amidase [Gammaproteobacteria bacterium]|nr:N-acetylmuramoyl-L-alanine amidase [Gammaproteobacteria bacterium]NNJ95290.1 AMIN domain-containing protein [Halobacteria archaeon]
MARIHKNQKGIGATSYVKRLLTGLFVWLAAISAVQAATEFKGMRLWAAPDHTRVVFDTSGPVSHELFSLPNPDRLVIDVQAAAAAETLQTAAAVGGLVKGVRTAINKPGVLRIVLDLKQTVKPRSFNLSPNDRYGHRLVVDLYESDSQAALKKVVATKPAVLRDLVIAIDAGHGGDDPGAVGRHGTREKDVVMSIARRLAKLIEAEPGMRPVMVREGDYYIGLRKRIDKARKHGADLFISIHADGFRDRRASGSSVYVLSRRGASSEMARVLAAKENAADLAGGVSLDDKDELLREVLLDLSQTATLEASFEMAENMLGELKRIGKTHKQSVQQAGFLVLKSPDIPSILVETAFITNPSEEKRLRSQKHQQKLARAMLRGIRDYFGTHRPPGTHGLTRQYVVKSGDTLSHIALRHQVSLNTLRGFNDLKSDTVRVGDKLRIPPTRGS